MKVELKLEKLTGHAKDAVVGEIFKKAGDSVTAGEVLLEVESGKGAVEIQSNATGVIDSVEVETGTKIPLGKLLMAIDGEPAADNDAGAATPPGQNGEDGKFSYSFGPAKPTDRELTCEIAVIGGGPGGYVAALQAAKRGAEVILIEKDSLGGTCLNRGCIPTKALIRSAEVYRTIKNAEQFGLGAGHYPPDIRQIVRRKDEVVKELVQGIGYLLEKNGVTVLTGEGMLQEDNRVTVKEARYNTTVTAKDVILATGSSSCGLPIPGLEGDRILTSSEALDMQELPTRMAIIGGGIIGMEFAFLFSQLGVDITVFEYFDTILSVFDQDIRDEITEAARQSGIRLVTGAAVQELLENESGGSILRYQVGDEQRYDLFEEVLLAVGRKPCYSGIDLDRNGIELTGDSRGIAVDEGMRTSRKGVYAIGDITNKIQLAHVASHQAVVAVDNILGGDAKMDYSVVPSAVFTFPEFAVVGLSEKDAEKKGREVLVSKFPFAANGKALMLGEREGFVKLLADPETKALLGGAVLGPHATDLIGEITLAVRKGLTYEDIAETIHAHPTTAESIHEAALGLGLGALHF